jgi:hypothetical protein
MPPGHFTQSWGRGAGGEDGRAEGRRRLQRAQAAHARASFEAAKELEPESQCVRDYEKHFV